MVGCRTRNLSMPGMFSVHCGVQSGFPLSRECFESNGSVETPSQLDGTRFWLTSNLEPWFLDTGLWNFQFQSITLVEKSRGAIDLGPKLGLCKGFERLPKKSREPRMIFLELKKIMFCLRSVRNWGPVQDVTSFRPQNSRDTSSWFFWKRFDSIRYG